MKKRVLTLLMALIIVFALAFAACGSSRNMQQETFVFNSLPKSASELKAMPEAAMTTPFMTAALTVAVLCAYGDNQAACIEMLNVLKGPEPLSNYDIQFMRDRLTDKTYKPFSYFAGASPQNGYVPNTPYPITVFEQAYSYPTADYATLYIRSGGADSPRSVTLRLKPSTGQWFLTNHHSLLPGIRRPDAENPWS